MQRKMCDLTIVADHTFFAEVGGGSLDKTILQMLWHIKEANTMIQTEDFDNDGPSECIGFTVSEITIFQVSQGDQNEKLFLKSPLFSGSSKCCQSSHRRFCNSRRLFEEVFSVQF